jgi:hypothetical protein
MKIHEREQLTRAARLHLMKFLLEFDEFEHEGMRLTGLEYTQLIQQELGNTLDRYFKYQLRIERHGDDQTPASIAGTKKRK